MIEETLKQNDPLKINKLEVEYRNRVQEVIIQKMLDSGAVKSQMEWADTYSKIISDIIDNADNETIRSLILEGSNDRAADMIIDIILGKIDRKAA